MTTLGRSWTKARAVCPRPEPVGSRVRLERRYGKPGHRRQMYRCIPANGDRSRRFTELLSREDSWTDTCESCERPIDVHEGPQAARHYELRKSGYSTHIRRWLRATGGRPSVAR